VYVLRRPSVRPGPRAFWLGGVCEGAAGMASGRDGIGEGAQLDSVLGGSLRELAHAVRDGCRQGSARGCWDPPFAALLGRGWRSQKRWRALTCWLIRNSWPR